jgi:hypothetical protein
VVKGLNQKAVYASCSCPLLSGVPLRSLGLNSRFLPNFGDPSILPKLILLDRRCLVEVPNAPHHRAERAHADADYDEEAAFDNYFNPEAGHRAGPEGPTNA